MSDQDRISPYNTNIIPSRQVMRIKEKCQLVDYKLIQFQILQTNITRTVWQTVSRITNEILGVKGLMINGQAISGLLTALLKKSQVPMNLKKLADISMSEKRQL